MDAIKFPEIGYRGQIILNFMLGFMFAPWSFGFVITIIFFLVYESFYSTIYSETYTAHERMMLVVAYFSGFIFGKFLTGDPISP